MEEDLCEACAAHCWDIYTCSFEYRRNRLALGLTGSVITIGLSINGCSHSKKTVDKREQN